jgi:tetratricopeptide (TPR) repeat protein
VFRDEFRRDAAERVAGASLSHLSALMHKSLLRRGPRGGYEMLQTLQQYAEAKLRESASEWDEVHDLHCAYYAEFLHRQQEHLESLNEKKALEEIKGAIENVRTAWQWAVSHRKVEKIEKSLAPLTHFYDRQNWFHEGERALGEAARGLGGTDRCESEEELIVLGRVLARQGWLCQALPRIEEAREILQQSLSVFRRAGKRAEMAHPLSSLAVIAGKSAEYAEVKRLCRESLAIYTEIGDRQGMVVCLRRLGIAAWKSDEFAEAKRLLQDSLSIAQEIGSRWDMAASYIGLGLVAEAVGEYADAVQFHQKSLGLRQEIGDRHALATCLNNLGFALYATGEYQEADRYFHEALGMALDAQGLPEALEALVGIATLLAKRGEKERAVELAALALHHPANYVQNQDRAEHLLSEMEPQLSHQAFAAAQERGKKRDLEETARTCGATI